MSAYLCRVSDAGKREELADYLTKAVRADMHHAH
jgi:hypothetical protein